MDNARVLVMDDEEAILNISSWKRLGADGHGSDTEKAVTLGNELCSH